jgi:hypothetical protein
MLDDMTGAVDDIARPLCDEFRVARAVVEDLVSSVKSGNRLTTLVGPVLSGRPNVLAQLCDREDILPIYMDADSARHGPIRYMANVIGRKLFRGANEDAVRAWLLQRIQQPGANRIAIVLGGWRARTGERTIEAIHELLQLCKDNAISLVVSTDEGWLESLVQGTSGQPTRYGREAKVVHLWPLSRSEFAAAAQQLAEKWNLYFERGAEYNADYRQPGFCGCCWQQSQVAHPPPLIKRSNEWR